MEEGETGDFGVLPSFRDMLVNSSVGKESMVPDSVKVHDSVEGDDALSKLRRKKMIVVLLFV